MKIHRTFCAAGLLVASTILGADLSGIWAGRIPGRGGDLQDIAFKFKQSGDELTGKMYLDSDELPISDGRISGDQISFTVSADTNGRPAKFRFTGLIKGTELQLTREREGGGGGGVEGGGGGRGSQKQTFTLSRLS